MMPEVIVRHWKRDPDGSVRHIVEKHFPRSENKAVEVLSDKVIREAKKEVKA